jgi:hypothetical protein
MKFQSSIFGRHADHIHRDALVRPTEIAVESVGYECKLQYMALAG